MNTHYRPSPLISSFPLVLVASISLVFLHHPAATASSTTPFDFIRSSCNTTLYPNLCYTSLSRYADAVQSNPAQLAKVAVGISLAKARRMSAYVSKLARRQSEIDTADPRAVSALHDCCSTMEAAIDQTRDSLQQMRQLGSSTGNSAAGSEDRRFALNNVQTWMSAAMTNEDTCSDGFESVKDQPMKSDVCGKVAEVTKFTSNALALVDSYAASLNN